MTYFNIKLIIFYIALLYFISNGIFYLPHILISKNNITKLIEKLKFSKKTIFICSHDYNNIDSTILPLISIKNLKHTSNIVTKNKPAIYTNMLYKFLFNIPFNVVYTGKTNKKEYLKMNKRIIDRNENLVIFMKRRDNKAKGAYNAFIQTDANIVIIKLKIKPKIKPIEIKVEDVDTQNLKTKNLDEFNKIILNKLYN